VAELRYTILHVLIDNIGWTPVPAPEFGIGAHFWSTGGYAMEESSTPTGVAGTTRAIPAGERGEIEVPRSPANANRSGISGGDPITYLKSSQAADEVIVRFFRW
jgi:hypothetical protein